MFSRWQGKCGEKKERGGGKFYYIQNSLKNMWLQINEKYFE